MREVYLKGSEFQSVKEIHEFLAEKLELPPYYGGNLDALYDVLTELCQDTRILLNLAGVEDEGMAAYFRRLGRVLEDAADVSAYLQVELKKEDDSD